MVTLAVAVEVVHVPALGGRVEVSGEGPHY